MGGMDQMTPEQALAFAQEIQRIVRESAGTFTIPADKVKQLGGGDLNKGHELLQDALARGVMKRRRNALRDLAKR